jgi:hypothetical protein
MTGGRNATVLIDKQADKTREAVMAAMPHGRAAEAYASPCGIGRMAGGAVLVLTGKMMSSLSWFAYNYKG